MLHRSKSLRTFFGTLFVALMIMATATPAAAAPTAEEGAALSVVTEMRLLWAQVLEWVGATSGSLEADGGPTVDPLGGNAEGGPSFDPLGNDPDDGPSTDPLGGENNADGGPSFDPLG